MQEGALLDAVPLSAFIRRFRLAGRALAVGACISAALAPACRPPDPASARAAEVESILEAHMEHEDALLDILERHRANPTAAEAELDVYLAEYGGAMSALCAKRRQLEADPTALATAMRELSPEMSRVFERRRLLAAGAPELLAREKVRAALATLDAL